MECIYIGRERLAMTFGAALPSTGIASVAEDMVPKLEPPLQSALTNTGT
jgi:hypothetical protein